MVPLVFNHFRGRNAFSEFFLKKLIELEDNALGLGHG
jgi:hypothetical protein